MKKILIPTFTFALILVFSTTSFAADVAKVLFSQQGKLTVGKSLNVDVFIDSSTTVNAAQITIIYPTDEFSLQKVDSTKSKFSISASEKVSQGSITIAKGNVEPLKGRNLLVTLVLKPLKSSSSIGNLSYNTSDSLVMSTQNVNILSGSQVLTQKPSTPPTQKRDSGFISLVKKTVSEFVNGLLGKK